MVAWIGLTFNRGVLICVGFGCGLDVTGCGF